jgi:hypothetical protein
MSPMQILVIVLSFTLIWKKIRTIQSVSKDRKKEERKANIITLFILIIASILLFIFVSQI